MQTARSGVGLIVKFAAGVQCRHDDTLRGNALLMHIHRQSASVVLHSAGAVLLQRNTDLRTVTGKMLINRVVEDLIDEVIESLGTNTSDIHAGTRPDRLQAFQYRNAVCVIALRFCHFYP